MQGCNRGLWEEFRAVEAATVGREIPALRTAGVGGACRVRWAGEPRSGGSRGTRDVVKTESGGGAWLSPVAGEPGMD